MPRVHRVTSPTPRPPPAAAALNDRQRRTILALAKSLGLSDATLKQVCAEETGSSSVAKLAPRQADKVIAALRARERAGGDGFDGAARVKLGELPAGLRPYAAKLDLNGDKVLDARDFPGASKAQVGAILEQFRAMRADFATGHLAKSDVAGKRVFVDGLDRFDAADAARIIRALGGTPVDKLDARVDLVIVGKADRTTADERAFRLIAQGAKIKVAHELDFVKVARTADTSGPEARPVDSTPAGRVGEHLRAYGEHRIGYAEAFRRAVEAVIRDGDDPESPRSIVAYNAESEGERLSARALDARMRELLSDGGLELLPVGESSEAAGEPPTHWIFAVDVDSGSDHGFWASVNRDTGKVEVNGFN